MRSAAGEPIEVGEPDLDERPHLVLEPCLACDGERLLIALARLGRVDALLEPVVPGHEQLLDPLTWVVPLHKRRLTRQDRRKSLAGAATNLRKSIRVLIADDHRLFAQALEAILAIDERIEVAGHASDGAEAVELEAELDPDVTLMDIAMPGMDGFQATRLIRERKPGACILILTGSNSRGDVDEARKAGAAGYVTKDRIAAELVDAIIEVGSK
jgi:CheY-like chemotaxis protein